MSNHGRITIILSLYMLVCLSVAVIFQGMLAFLSPAYGIDEDCESLIQETLEHGDVDHKKIECDGEKINIYRTERLIVPSYDGDSEYRVLKNSNGQDDTEKTYGKIDLESRLNKIEKSWYEGRYKEFINLSTPLAQNGDIEAQYRLGVAYLMQEPPEYSEAAYWLRLASESGHIAAKFELALLYLSGSGVRKNIEIGVSLLTDAAHGGHENAMKILKDARERGLWGL